MQTFAAPCLWLHCSHCVSIDKLWCVQTFVSVGSHSGNKYFGLTEVVAGIGGRLVGLVGKGGLSIQG